VHGGVLAFKEAIGSKKNRRITDKKRKEGAKAKKSSVAPCAKNSKKKKND